jgi:hypothetical protein
MLEHLEEILWAIGAFVANGLLVAAVSHPRVVVLLSFQERGTTRTERPKSHVLRIAIQNLDRGALRGPLHLVLRMTGAGLGEAAEVKRFIGPRDRVHVSITEGEKLVIASGSKEDEVGESLRARKTWVFDVPVERPGRVVGLLELPRRPLDLPLPLRVFSRSPKERVEMPIEFPQESRRRRRDADTKKPPEARYEPFVRDDWLIIALVNLLGVTTYGFLVSLGFVKFDWRWDAPTVAVCAVLTTLMLYRARPRIPTMIQGYLEPKEPFLD